MNQLMLVAASGLAREVLAVERLLRRFDRIRVVDDDPARWGTTIAGEPIVGGLDLVTEYDDHDLLVCAGQGRTRRAIVNRLVSLGVTPDRFTRSVHPRVQVTDGCTVGPGSIVLDGVVLTANVQLGAHVVAMPHVTLTHDVVVEDFATLCAGVSLGGAVRVGSGAYLGMNAAVRERLSIGRDAVLGMGAALVHHLPDGEVWTGVPARPVSRKTEVER